ncbi:uncharacterized protein EAE98_003514 [Botrytis deweyae]|uniref:Uncharacterized protein n=1 Tax=Botrytis deweyae TaxID=2478750 RepID=A0ABQ7ITU4_9HELO|nr:uncharacterized protein EAE98_003514 [Botrytis deweyae]KAF7933805.1 hypothetical protein EAE98_003514 [Botrytis deweyae]
MSIHAVQRKVETYSYGPKIELQIYSIKESVPSYAQLQGMFHTKTTPGLDTPEFVVFLNQAYGDYAMQIFLADTFY